MTKYLFTAFLSLSVIYLTFGCTPDREPDTASNQQPDTRFPDMAHNSQNALDWMGTYHGITPCADCEGIETALTLNEDHTYILETRYLGKSDEVFRESGTFTWNDDGSQIEIDVGDEGACSAHYLIQENRIIQLDLDGNRITGNLADYYVLDKITNRLADRYWRLSVIGGTVVDTTRTGPKDPHIILHPLGNKASGTGGCNSVSADYRISEENRISFSQVISTRMACQDAAYETDFIQLMERASTYTLESDTLTLFSDEGDSLLVFIEQPEFN